jgi:transposase
MVLFAGVFGMWTIKKTLYRLGFRRQVARRKPPITEETRQKRLAFALEHIDWTLDQWRTILWTDETWVTAGPHRKQYVTRRQGEEWEDTCIVERHQRKGGWMFWGSFSGLNGKGPGLFWEKDWGTITEESYCQHIVPMICGWLRLSRSDGHHLVFIQDNAPAHSAKGTLAELAARGITVLWWPPNSPDLTPIEACWNWMKDYLEDKYGLEERISYDRHRLYVQEGWDALPQSFLDELIESMPARMHAVVKAEGRYTKY